MLENELSVAIAAARIAGKEILRVYNTGFDVFEKSKNLAYSEPVTSADINASDIIVKMLSEAFPNDAILSEEAPDDTRRRLQSDRVWMIDPLDGTKGFIEKQGDFAVQIALIEEGIPILGVVFQPTKSQIYTAVRGEGTLFQNAEGRITRLYVSEKTHLSEMTLAASRSHRSKKMDEVFNSFGFRKEIRHGSVGLKVGLLAQKLADIYIHLSPHTKFWDTAAPQVILEEAGGKLTDLFGMPIVYSISDVQNHNGILATNSIAQEMAIDRLRPLLAEFGRARQNP